MNKENKGLVKKYLKEVSNTVVCSYSVKRLFIKELYNKIMDAHDEGIVLSYNNLCEKFGTPSEIANGFGDLKLDKYVKQAKIYKYILIISSIFLILLTTFITIMILSNGTITVTSDEIITSTVFTK